jgi:hypothetical protein
MLSIRNGCRAAALAAFALLPVLAGGASAATVHQVSQDLIVIEVPATTYGWQATGINITANSKWYLTVQGIANVAWTVDTVNWDRWATPGGEPARLPINLTHPQILVSTARIGGVNGTKLYVGGGGAIPPPYDQTPAISGLLELGYNDSNSDGNINSFLVIMHCYAGDCACQSPLAAPDPAVPVDQTLVIDGNSPNPVLSSTSIRFAVPASGDYTIGIFDPGGRMIRDLSGGQLAAGNHTVAWDGRDQTGRMVEAGVYFCRLDGGTTQVARKMVVVR